MICGRSAHYASGCFTLADCNGDYRRAGFGGRERRSIAMRRVARLHKQDRRPPACPRLACSDSPEGHVPLRSYKEVGHEPARASRCRQGTSASLTYKNTAGRRVLSRGMPQRPQPPAPGEKGHLPLPVESRGGHGAQRGRGPWAEEAAACAAARCPERG